MIDIINNININNNFSPMSTLVMINCYESQRFIVNVKIFVKCWRDCCTSVNVLLEKHLYNIKLLQHQKDFCMNEYFRDFVQVSFTDLDCKFWQLKLQQAVV